MRYLAAAVLAATSSVAHAQEYPCDQVVVVVPYSAGGATSTVSRVVAEGLEERLGTSVVIEPRPGAGGNVGTRSVAEAEPDGCTVLVNGNQMATMPLTITDLGYDPFEDFVAIGNVGLSPTLIVSSKDEISDLQDMIAAGEEGTVNYGTPGVGLLQHLAMEQITFVSGADLNHVPYRGGADALADLISGRLDVGAFAAGSVLPPVRDGQLTLLGAAQEERTGFAPDVPSAAEQGFEGINAGVYFLMFAPAGTPEDAVDMMSTALSGTLSDPAMADRFAEIGFEPIPMNPEETAALMRQTADEWSPVIERLGISFD